MFTSKDPNMAPPPPDTDRPVTRAEVRELFSRLVRIESKITRLLNHHGMDGNGQPLQHNPESYDAAQPPAGHL